MYEVGLNGTTLAIAVIYGWTGGRKGSAEAARTDDMLTFVQMQFPSSSLETSMDQPKLPPTLQAMLSEKGWTDFGTASNLCEGKPGQSNCQTKDTAKESRIDYFFAN